MLRRSFLNALSAVSALPRIPDRLHPHQRPPIPSEGSIMFWYYFYSALQRDRTMSTERAREKAVKQIDLHNLTDDEAVQILGLAEQGVYDTDDIPGRWKSIFESVEVTSDEGPARERH